MYDGQDMTSFMSDLRDERPWWVNLIDDTLEYGKDQIDCAIKYAMNSSSSEPQQKSSEQSQTQSTATNRQ